MSDCQRVGLYTYCYERSKRKLKRQNVQRRILLKIKKTFETLRATKLVIVRFIGTNKVSGALLVPFGCRHSLPCCPLSNAFDTATRACHRPTNGKNQKTGQTDRRTDGSQHRFMSATVGRNIIMAELWLDFAEHSVQSYARVAEYLSGRNSGVVEIPAVALRGVHFVVTTAPSAYIAVN